MSKRHKSRKISTTSHLYTLYPDSHFASNPPPLWLNIQKQVADSRPCTLKHVCVALKIKEALTFPGITTVTTDVTPAKINSNSKLSNIRSKIRFSQLSPKCLFLTAFSPRRVQSGLHVAFGNICYSLFISLTSVFVFYYIDFFFFFLQGSKPVISQISPRSQQGNGLASGCITPKRHLGFPFAYFKDYLKG